MRIIRLILAIIIVAEAIWRKDALFGFFGLVFLAMTVFNAGCCGASCSTGNIMQKPDSKEIEFEEIK
jgi:hypothetical protein